MKQKTRIVIATLCAMLLVVVAIFLVQFRKPAASKQTPQVAQTEQKNDEKMFQQMSELLKTKDLGSCEQLSDQYYKDICIRNIAYSLAREKADASYCDKIAEKTMQENCQKSVLTMKIVQGNDPKVCDGLVNQVKDECLNKFWLTAAVKNGNVNDCNNLASPGQIKLCQDGYLLQTEMIKDVNNFDCNRFTQPESIADCDIFKNAISSKNPNDCKNLKINSFQFQCRTQILNLTRQK